MTEPASTGNPLDGLARPPGNSALIGELAREQHNKAARLTEAAHDLGVDAKSVAARWNGCASDAFCQRIGALSVAVAALAEAHGGAGAALDTWADALQAAQTAYDEAAVEACLAMEQEREAAEQAQQLLDPFAAQVSGQLPPAVSPLRSVARQDAQAAIAYARDAAARCADALRAFTPRPPAPPEAPPPEQKHHGLLSSIGHSVLDVAGLIPVVGEPADGVNAAWYAGQGDHLNAGLSAAGMVPLFGWGATAAKAGLKGAKAAEKAEHAEETARHADRWADATHAARTGEAATDAGRAASKPRSATVGYTNDFNYRRTYINAHPEAEGKVWVHHAVEQDVLVKYPGLFTANELHSLENLRGIPNEINGRVHLSEMRVSWNEFYRTHRTPTRDQILAKATEVDALYGPRYLPPHP